MSLYYLALHVLDNIMFHQLPSHYSPPAPPQTFLNLWRPSPPPSSKQIIFQTATISLHHPVPSLPTLPPRSNITIAFLNLPYSSLPVFLLKFYSKKIPSPPPLPPPPLPPPPCPSCLIIKLSSPTTLYRISFVRYSIISKV